MAIRPRVGTMLVSRVDGAGVVVVRWPDEERELTCGGAPMVEPAHAVGEPVPVDPARAGGTLLGKRYCTADGAVELLCTRSGTGTLAVDGTPLDVKAAKALPVSD